MQTLRIFKCPTFFLKIVNEKKEEQLPLQKPLEWLLHWTPPLAPDLRLGQSNDLDSDCCSPTVPGERGNLHAVMFVFTYSHVNLSLPYIKFC